MSGAFLCKQSFDFLQIPVHLLPRFTSQNTSKIILKGALGENLLKYLFTIVLNRFAYRDGSFGEFGCPHSALLNCS